MKRGHMKKIIILLCISLLYLMSGCKNKLDVAYFTNEEQQHLEVTNEEQQLLEVTNEVVKDTVVIEKDIKHNENIEYTTIKLDFYNQITLNKDFGEYVFIYSVFDNRVLFSIEQTNYDEIGETGRSKTLKIGIYDITSNTVEFVKEFSQATYVNDMLVDTNGDIVYVYYCEGKNWYISKITDKDEVSIDEGGGFRYIPKLERIGERIFYLYEKINITDLFIEYQYGINEITKKNEIIELDINKLKARDNLDIIERESLINDAIYCSSDTIAYLKQEKKIPYVDVYSLEMEETKKIIIDGRIHNISFIQDSIVMSLENSDTGNISLECVDYKTERKDTSNITFPLYRMESDNYHLLMAINSTFDVFLLSIVDNKVSMINVLIDDHIKEPVLFCHISENKFLLNYIDLDVGNNDLYLLEVR